MTNKILILTIDELNAYEKKWRRIFSAHGLVLVAALGYLVAFYYSPWNYNRVCYVVGSLAAIACLHAAKKLRDVERVDAIVFSEALLDGHMDDGVEDIDD
ncbi:hypothetical protein [Undibacterium sp. Ji22W]|uniref:hypothetical protein n=1 Tax=Undibacterium sp. Ji22W TaxID=3413038 RepID=UPI003BF28D56